MAPKQDAALFNQIIAEGRERKKREDLASTMLGTGRRSSAPSAAGLRKPANGSLASRIGVSKIQRSGSVLSRPSSAAPLTTFRKPALQSRPLNRTVSDSRLDRKARAVANLADSDASSNLRHQVNFQDHTTDSSGFSFRGQAQGEPVSVIAQNFAPGTTSADIESVIQPMVDEDVVCKILSASPTVIAEMQFRDGPSADRVVQTFNNKRADGRILHVYINKTNPFTKQKGQSVARNATNGRRAQNEDTMEVDEDRRRYDEQRRYDEERRNNRRSESDLQDGRYGFDEPGAYQDARPSRPAGRERGDRGLYSDRMTGRGGSRGNNRGR